MTPNHKDLNKYIDTNSTLRVVYSVRQSLDDKEE